MDTALPDSITTVDQAKAFTGPVAIGGSVLKGDYITVAGNGSRKVSRVRNRGRSVPYKHWEGSVLESWRKAMDVTWIKGRKAIANAIPPAYTEYISKLFLNFYESKKKIDHDINEK